MIKFAREGYPFIFIFALLTILSAVFGRLWLIPFPLAILIAMCFFFRDPERVTPEGRGIFYSPADGKVILIRETEENELLNDRALEISIFMSPANVHINRSPCKGAVREVKHYPGRFLAAFRQEASMLNEHITMLLETDYGDVVVKQVAGFLARRAVCRVKPGDSLMQGQRFGLIKFSSRVDIFLPLTTQIKIKLNDKVKAGESILGVIK
jgi:phosphatidylserine decarboxylase